MSCNLFRLLNPCKYGTNYESITAVFPSLLKFSASLMQILSPSLSKLNLQSFCPLTNNVSYSFGFSFHLSLYNSFNFNTNNFSHLHLFVLYKITSQTFKVDVPPHSIYKVHFFNIHCHMRPHAGL